MARLNIVRAIGGNGKLWNWWQQTLVRGVDHDAILRQIAEDSGWSGRYAFLIVVSAAISLLGLLMPSVAVLIGAMLLSPLMMPIIGLGFGIATLDFVEIRRAAIALVAGSVIAVVFSALFVTISPVQNITSEIAGRTQPTLFDLLVALLSAMAGAYALIRGRGSTVVGVAIAIALMPPLAVVGFGIATWNWTVFSGSLLLFLTNAVTIALTAALMARAYGFGSHLSPRHTGWQLALFVVAVGVLSIPLGAALQQFAFESLAQHQVREKIRAEFPRGSRLSQLDIDYTASPIQVRAVMLTPTIDPGADRTLATGLRQLLARPVDVHVDQLVISLDQGAAEAEQLARAAEAGAARRRDTAEQIVTQLSLVAGVERSAITIDSVSRTASANAVPLPGVEMLGYRALEQRIGQAQSGWRVRLAPPADMELPSIPVNEGVIDDETLSLASWASERLGRTVLVHGGRRAQREAVAAGIVVRGGSAIVGDASGTLRLSWE
jgi:uncharacterized hydrophobic protein (TIGR00271 family)